MILDIKIKIKGNLAELDLFDVQAGRVLGSLKWEDRRDLSDKLFLKINLLLKKKKAALKNVRRISFDCDSPYFQFTKRKQEIKMEDFDSAGKCGFTTWQTGEIIAKVLNFAKEK
jgi:hypothetical protein